MKTTGPKHTPTPYKLKRRTVHFYIESADGIQIAQIRMVARPDGLTSEDDAAFIVQACNEHAALVKVAEAMKEIEIWTRLHNCSGIEGHPNSQVTCESVNRKALRALTEPAAVKEGK